MRVDVLYNYAVSQKLHWCSKITLTHVKPIWIIFDRDVVERVCYQRSFIFPSRPTNVSALLSRTRKREYRTFKCCINGLRELKQSLLEFLYCSLATDDFTTV